MTSYLGVSFHRAVSLKDYMRDIEALQMLTVYFHSDVLRGTVKFVIKSDFCKIIIESDMKGYRN